MYQYGQRETQGTQPASADEADRQPVDVEESQDKIVWGLHSEEQSEFQNVWKVQSVPIVRRCDKYQK